MNAWQQALIAALPIIVAGGWWMLQRAKREDWQREMREAAEGLARAQTDEERAVWRAIIEDLERDARADDKGDP